MSDIASKTGMLIADCGASDEQSADRLRRLCAADARTAGVPIGIDGRVGGSVQAGIKRERDGQTAIDVSNGKREAN